MTQTGRARLAWSIAIASLVVTGVCLIVALPLGWTNTDPMLSVTVILATVSWGVIGALIAARTGNPIGWVLLGVIGLLAFALATQTYATLSLVELGGRLPLDTLLGLLNQVSFVVMLSLIVAIPLLYPTGTARWRWVWRVYLACLAVTAIGWVLLPQLLSLAVDQDVFAPPENPLGVEALRSVLGVALGVSGITILGCAVLGVVSLVVRFREAEGDARQQIKWLVYVGIVALTALLLTMVSFGVLGDPPAPGLPTFISNALFAVTLWTIVFGIPAACGVAILRYRLYDLDVVIKKTLVALVLAVMIAVLALVALGVAGRFAVGSTSRSFALVIGIALGIAVVPLLRLARRVADRVVYGRRATPYEVLATFSGRVGETYSSDDVLPRMAEVLRAGTGASSVRVLVRVGTAPRVAAAAGEAAGPEHVEPIAFQGDDIGALAVTFPPNDPIDETRRQLIANLAAQAGPVVRNVRLIEELRASRQRLVTAQDEERRKLERNIHDGVQQQLVALNVQLGLLGRVAEREPTTAGRMATELQQRATEALEDLRNLARGIYPPVLADQGLVAALEGQARKAAVPTSVSADGVGRYDRAVESAVYFCSLEALNNAAKYADASSVRVRLAQTDGRLRFEVADDGAGFDPDLQTFGTGLQGMADRLDAIGGELRVSSEPGRGTTVTGTVPV
jgi:signal transduction histidine kinase